VKVLSEIAHPMRDPLTASIGHARNRVPGVIIQTSAVQSHAALHAVHPGKSFASPGTVAGETKMAEPCAFAEETQLTLPLSAGLASSLPTIAPLEDSSRKEENKLASLAANDHVLSSGDAVISERDSSVSRKLLEIPNFSLSDYIFGKDSKRPMGGSAQLRRSSRAGKWTKTVSGLDTSPVDDSSIDMRALNKTCVEHVQVLASASTVSCAADETSTPVRQKVDSVPAISHALQEHSRSCIGMGCIPMPPPPPLLPQSFLNMGTGAKKAIIPIKDSQHALNGVKQLDVSNDRAAQESTLSQEVKQGPGDGISTQDAAIRVQGSLKKGVKRSKSDPECTTSGPSHELTKKCPSCDRMHNGKFGNGKFCGLSCSKTAGAKARWGTSAVARKALEQPSKSSQAHARRKSAKRKKDSGAVTKLGKRSSVSGAKPRSGSRIKVAEASSARIPCDTLPATSTPTVSERLPSNAVSGAGGDGCGPVGQNVSDLNEIELAPLPWVRDDFNLPPKKKPRGHMMFAFTGTSSETESERSIAVSGPNGIDCKKEVKPETIVCSPIEQGLVGEDILYRSGEDSAWKRGHLVEYRVHDDMHRVQCAGERAAWRWMDLRAIQVSWEQSPVDGGRFEV
jgi:hypothetical protein